MRKLIILKLKTKIFQEHFLHSIAKHIFFLFPFLWFLILFFSILESFTYSGFVHKHIFFGFQFFLLLTILGGFLIKFGLPPESSIRKKWVDYYKILAILNNLAFPVILSATLIASAVEQAHYPNYVFSKIHLQPKNLYWVCFVSLYLIVLDLGNLGKVWFLDKAIFGKKIAPRLTMANLKRIVVLFLVLWVLISNVRFASAEMFKNLLFITKHPFATYDEKMKIAWGDFYDYMVFLKENTPSDAKIAHPPWEIPPWLSTGSQPLVRYFLYPRELFQTKDAYSLSPEADYAMLAWGFWECPKQKNNEKTNECQHGWPKVTIPAEWIIYKKENSTEIKKRIENAIYNPNDEINQYAWGLIKIKKD